jgi:hypothetical protein
MHRVQVDAAKHEMEARMRKAELDAVMVANKAALEIAHKVMPADLARQLLGTHALSLGGSSTGLGLSTSLLALKDFTVEQAIQFVAALGKPFLAFRETMEDSGNSSLPSQTKGLRP